MAMDSSNVSKLADIVLFAGFISTFVTGTIYHEAAMGIIENEKTMASHYGLPLPTYSEYRQGPQN